MEKIHLNQNAVDYNYLDLLLALEDWQEADLETKRLICKVVGIEDGWLTWEHVKNFPCEDLHKINDLWLRYSHGKFGFSVQIEIYQSLGGTEDYSREIWSSFGDQVGWCVGFGWIFWKDHTFDLNAPKGHLPTKVFQGSTAWSCRLLSATYCWSDWGGEALLSLAQTCNLVPCTSSNNVSL